MSVIKPRTRGKQFIQHRTRLDRENHETLYAYAAFLDETPEYVLNELIDTILAKDKDFIKWRSDHPQSCTPRPSPPPTALRDERKASGTVSESAARKDISPASTPAGRVS
jgi:hypothetical protein